MTVVHKANVLRQTCGLFRRVALEVASEYPEIHTEEMLVDTCAMELVRAPEQFEVIVTTNLFGDILSDEASMLVGGLGVACFRKYRRAGCCLRTGARQRAESGRKAYSQPDGHLSLRRDDAGLSR